MPQARSLESIQFDPEIEHSLSQIHKEKAIMTEHQIDESPKTLRDYAMKNIDGTVSSIRRSIIQDGNFEMKPVIIQTIQQSMQFGYLSQEELNIHITS